MSMRVSDFTKMAGTGDGVLRMDSGTGKLQVGDKGFFGKIVGWFRAKSDPGKIQGENMSAMNAFIRAIGEDPKYGPEFANMATRTLTPLLEKGKPLSAQVVRQIVGQIEKQQGQVNGLNRMLGERFSEYDIHGDPNCFGSVFANVGGERGFNIPLDKLDASRLKEAIREAITTAGQNGQHAVSIQEAKEIAKQEIEKFIGAKQTLFTSIDQMDASPTDKAALKELVCKFGHIRKPEYLQQVLTMKQAGQALFTALSKPDCSRTEIMTAMAKYNEAYGVAFAKIRDGATGADDVVRFGGDSLDLALMTAGLSKEGKERLYSLLTSQSSRELRQALSYIGINQSDLKGVSEQSAQKTASIMGRSQEFISELATTVGLSLGLTREQTFKALDEPPITFDNWMQVPKDVGDFARAQGATVPTGLDEIHEGTGQELERLRDTPVQMFRTNTDVSKQIAAYMKNHGKPCLDHALRCLDQAKQGGGDAQAIYARFMTAFLGGTTPREVLAFVSKHPEIFGSVRELARNLHAQGLEKSPEHAFFSVQNSVFLRGIVPALTMHNYDSSNPQSSKTEMEIGRLFQNTVGALHGNSPDPLMQAFFNGLVREDVNPERLETQFNQISEKLLAHKSNSVDDETGPMRAPQGFAREVVEFNQSLRQMREYCEQLGLNFSQTFPGVDEKMASVATHLAGVVKPSNLMLGELNRRQLAGFEGALKSLGVDYPQTPFRTEHNTRLAPLQNAYKESITKLATAVRGGNTEAILNGLRAMLDAGDQCLQATNELGGRVDDADKIKKFRMDMFRQALSGLPEQEVLDLVGLLSQPQARILVDGLVDVGYGVLERDENLGKRVLSVAIGLGELREGATTFLEQRGVKLPPIPDEKQYTLNDLAPSQRTAIRNIFGLSCEDGKVRIASGTVNDRFMHDFLEKLNTPLVESERAMQTLTGGEKTGVTEQFWKDFARGATWNITDGSGTHSLYSREGWDGVGKQGQEIRLMDGVRQLRELCGNDPGMLEFVTQYSHQGLFACILDACKDPHGCPLRLPDGRSGVPMPGSEHMTYTFSRTESGDISVRVSWKAEPLNNLLTTDGQMINLDPTSKCQFDFEVTFTKDKQVLVSSPVKFDYEAREQ